MGSGRRLWAVVAGAALWLGAGCGPAAITPERVAEADRLCAQAGAFYDAKRPHLAVRELQEAVALVPDHAEAHRLLGLLLFGRGDDDEAIQHLRKALAIRPGDAEAASDLGAVYVAEGRFEEAIRTLEPLTESGLLEDPWRANLNLGWALYNLGRYDEAMVRYKLALFQNPALCRGYGELGMLYDTLGQRTLARDSYARAARYCPEVGSL